MLLDYCNNPLGLTTCEVEEIPLVGTAQQGARGFLSAMADEDFYLRYYVGHKGKFGHEFLEFEFKPDGRLRYANNSNYKNDTMIRKESAHAPASSFAARLPRRSALYEARRRHRSDFDCTCSVEGRTFASCSSG